MLGRSSDLITAGALLSTGGGYESLPDLIAGGVHVTDRRDTPVRHIDRDAFVARAAGERLSLPLLDRATGADRVSVNLIRTPTGGGSPEGLHTHAFEQIFYVLEGLMHLEIDGERHVVGPGSLVVFPEGVPHRNWAPEGPTLHLSINVPPPAEGVPVAVPVERKGWLSSSP
jgi:quercetin dioxygenase-like cupin family protein